MLTGAEAVPARGKGQASQGNRRGSVFSVRVTDEERAALEAAVAADSGPRALGPWLVWRAIGSAQRRLELGQYPAAAAAPVVPTPGPGSTSPAAPWSGRGGRRIVLDLCAGSGSWGEPYERAGYDVRRVTLPETDVRLYRPPPDVWGILAGPPCTEFSLAKNGQERDFLAGMETVAACMRIVLQCRASLKWWALENPTGLLGKYLGRPRDVFQPCDFGDPWTKRTALWGDFTIPTRGPFVKPTGSAMDRSTAAERAITPPGFSRAFFEANP